MKNRVRYSFLVLLLLQTVFTFGQIPTLVANSTGSFTYTPTGPLSSKPITVFYRIPAGNISTMPILFAFHGDERDGANYRDYWIAMANANNFMVFAPEYSEANYPGGDQYQLANVFVNGDSPSLATYNATNLWTFSTVDPIFETIKTAVVGTQQTYDAWGHSGGAQFLQRFRMYLPNSKLNTAICSNAGWYTVPETGIDFPYGLTKSQLTSPNLISAFSKRLIVHLGQNDTDPNSPGLRHNTTVDNQQGLMRLDRGRYFYDKSLAYAPAIGSAFNWQKQEVAGVGHDPQLMANNALNFLFQSNTTTSTATILDGGFENQPNSLAGGASGVLVISPTNWTANTTGSVVRTTTDTGGRTGLSCAQFGTTSTGAKIFFSPQLPGAFAPNTTYQIQFFYKPTVTLGTVASSSINLYVDNAGANPAGTLQSVAAGLSASASTTTWTKVSAQITANGTAAAANGVVGIAFTTSGTTPSFTANFDDFIIYQGTTPDTTAPNSPGAITATVAPSGGANLSWAAASGGVDGGGYMVVRYASATVPLPSDDPIQNGIYAVNNIIGSGAVRYIGTGTSYTDSGLSSGTDYYYKVYAVDKAFNYSDESTTSSPVNPSSTFYYKGTGSLADLSKWGTNTDGTGTAPLNFTDNSQVFEIRNTTAVATDAPWTIGGNGRVVVGASTLGAVTFTISSGFALSLGTNARLDIAAASSGNNQVIFQNASLPTIGTVDVSANITYANGVAGIAITNVPCNTLKISNITAASLDNTPSCKFLVVDSGSSITSGTTNVITIAFGGNATINGTFAGNRSKGVFTTGSVASADRGNIHSDDTNATITLGANSKIIYSRTSAQTIAPLGYADLEIRGTGVVLTTDIIVNKDFTLGATANVTLSAGRNLTVTNAIVNNGILTIQNNANLIQAGTTNTNTGNITVNRSSNALFRLDYTLWSSPVAGQNLLSFSPATIATRFYTYDNTLGTTGLYTAVASPSTTPFSTGTGYLIRMPDANAATNYNAGTGTLTYNGVFTGIPNNGTISFGVSSGTYNAVGNPYPSTISADTFITDNSIAEALYFWRKTNGAAGTAYATYTFAGGVGTGSGTSAITTNGTIQVGQGFIAKATGSTITFTNSMRTSNTANQILKTKVVERNRIWLNLSSSAGSFNQMMLAYMTGATQGIDAAIDGKYFNDSPTALNSLVNSEEFTIQGRSLPFDAADTVPLAFKTDVAGDYAISLDQVDGLFAGSQDIYLLDSKTGTETNLKEGAYNFTAPVGVDNSRFSLTYQKTLKVDAAAFSDSTIQVYKNNGSLYVNSTAKAINNIKVYDVQGRLIIERKNVKANTVTISNLGVENQVLLVRVTAEDNSEVTKKVMN